MTVRHGKMEGTQLKIALNAWKPTLDSIFWSPSVHLTSLSLARTDDEENEYEWKSICNAISTKIWEHGDAGATLSASDSTCEHMGDALRTNFIAHPAGSSSDGTACVNKPCSPLRR